MTHAELHSVAKPAVNQVEYRRIHRNNRQFAATIVVAVLSVSIELGLLGWLIQPATGRLLQQITHDDRVDPVFVAAIVVMELCG